MSARLSVVPKSAPALTDAQRDGVRYVFNELQRLDRMAAQMLALTAGIDEVIATLKLPIASTLDAGAGELLALMQSISDWKDGIQNAHYGVLFPNSFLGRVENLAQLRAEVARDLAEGPA